MHVGESEYEKAIVAFEKIKQADPMRVIHDGVDQPLSLVQGRLAARWVRRVAILPSEALLVAAHAHHLRRWEVPRESYPEGRAGYLKWRAERARSQAATTAELLADVGYQSSLVDRVSQIILKQGLASDPEVQAYEDAITLAFLELQLAETAAKLDEKAIDVLTKALAKMSDRGLRVLPEVPGLDRDMMNQALEPIGLPLFSKTEWTNPISRAGRLIADTVAVARDPAITITGQLGGLVLLHLILRERPDIRVVFGDTGYLPSESIEFIEGLADRWNLNLTIARPEESVEEHEAARGKLHGTDPVMCCDIRKVAPVEKVLAAHDVWFASLRNEQTGHRSRLDAVGRVVLTGGRPITKVLPLLGWEWSDVDAYAAINEVPRHPLYSQGYTSIGCAPCTRPTFGEGDDRSGRWEGKVVECGLHVTASGRREVV